ncbi:MAG: DUF4105 domain-containing protein, partial [Candidatus Dadabacteria bacterium]
MGLYEDRPWRTLLHVSPGSGGTSLMDDPSFFLAPRGKESPAEEMRALLLGLCAESPEDPDQHPRCRFPARTAWLGEQLGFSPREFGPAACPSLEEALGRMDPHGVTLAFPAAHPNGPASMFGHTLVRFDPPAGNPLLGYSVNYAAQTDPGDLALVYAWKGLFGGYRGYFTILPYYEKTRQYEHMEQRDVWEYQLNLSPEEARRAALHAWELKDRWARYFYLDENCSYNVLFLLEAARPGVHLTDRFPGWVTPIDTVRAVVREGLVGDVVFRPSAARKVRRAGRALGWEDAALADAIAAGTTDPERAAVERPIPRAAEILETAAGLVEVRYVRRELDEAAYKDRFLRILRARSRLGGARPRPVPSAGLRPDAGHGTSAVAAGFGADADGPFLSAAFRPAYHGLSDPPDGYTFGSEIDFFRGVVGFRPGTGTWELRRFDLISIVSMAPRDLFFDPVSWELRLGGTRLPQGGFAAVGRFGAGFTWGEEHSWLVEAGG